GDRAQRGGGGAGLDAPQESSSRPNISARPLLRANRIFPNDNTAPRPAPPPPPSARFARARVVPLPRFAGADGASALVPATQSASELCRPKPLAFCLQKNKGRQSAERRK